LTTRVRPACIERESKGELRGMDSELCDGVFADKRPSGAIRGPRRLDNVEKGVELVDGYRRQRSGVLKTYANIADV
jgi:hypothetical protein